MDGEYEAYVGYTGHALLLELSAVEGFHGLFEVRGRLILNEAVVLGQLVLQVVREGVYQPFAIGIAACLRVNDVTARLAGEVFQVLCPENPRKLKSRIEGGVLKAEIPSRRPARSSKSR